MLSLHVNHHNYILEDFKKKNTFSKIFVDHQQKNIILLPVLDKKDRPRLIIKFLQSGILFDKYRSVSSSSWITRIFLIIIFFKIMIQLKSESGVE